jgi:hypothetical protein
MYVEGRRMKFRRSLIGRIADEFVGNQTQAGWDTDADFCQDFLVFSSLFNALLFASVALRHRAEVSVEI